MSAARPPEGRTAAHQGEATPVSAVPDWIAAQTTALLAQRGHAWLLQGPSGLGQYPLALALVQAWLCERPTAHGACQTCTSCHAIEVRTHADLCVLMPETDMLALGWPLSERAQAEVDDKKRKPSKEIRVEAMRDAVEFSQRTSARGRGKAVLVYPAERMNGITANALLKTLEEPPGDVRFVLASEAAQQLLPTIRSRCLGHSMVWPEVEACAAWLLAQGVSADAARIWLRAAGGRPADALGLAQSGRDPKSWALLPRAMARGDLGPVHDWSPPELVNALQKLCHDLMAAAAQAAPRFFQAADLPKVVGLAALAPWSKALMASARTAEHPFNAGLMLETLVSQAQNALNSHR
jgi:DNA polymerase-3 subunit delta'